MHVESDQWELMCWLSGDVRIIIFDECGRITHKYLMNENNLRVIQISPKCYHTFIATEPSSYLEMRNCKYNPDIDRVYAEWSPLQDSDSAIDFLKSLCNADIGDLITI